MASRFAENYPDDWRQRREQVFERDGWGCRNCGADVGEESNTVPHCYHIVPISCSGAHKLDNLATLCEVCHTKTHAEMDRRGHTGGLTNEHVFAGAYLPELVEHEHDHDDDTDQEDGEIVAWEGAEDGQTQRQTPATKFYKEFSLPYRLKWWVFGVPEERQASEHGLLLYETIPDE